MAVRRWRCKMCRTIVISEQQPIACTVTGCDSTAFSEVVRG